MRTAFFRFLPTIPVYFVFHSPSCRSALASADDPVSLYFLGTMMVFGMGLAAFFAALQVYFRDTSSFLPYFIRIWMYLSPVLWLPEHAGPGAPGGCRLIIELNPLYSMLGGYAPLMQDQADPAAVDVDHRGRWAIGAVVVGFLFFISREREFAVRLT